MRIVGDVIGVAGMMIAVWMCVRGKIVLAWVGLAIFVVGAFISSAHAQAVYYPPLSGDDVQIIGRALDKLLGVDPADRVYTDRTHLYDRMQAYITARNQELSRAAFDKAIADAASKSEGSQP